MEKGKRIQAMDGQSQLPKEIIQHIQSFLSGKEAASTAVLSKSWYDSWLTRPCLDFDARYFRNQNSEAQSYENFLNFAKRSIERYRELNLSIESFKLWMDAGVRDNDSYSLATELIVNALKLGANCIDIEFNPPTSGYVLPEELFEAESLVGLFVVGCRILRGDFICSGLKSLRLCKVNIGDDMIRDIMLKCPLIENLFLSGCVGLLKVNLSKMVKLKSFSFISSKSVLLRTPLIEFENQSVGSVTNDRTIASEFRNLNCLLLESVKIDNWMFFCDFSKNFPCLENLTIHYCSGCLRYNISSNSLKYIAFANMGKLKVQLDVPNIRKFKFSGSIIPSLSLITTSSEWESRISLSCGNYLSVSWFLDLKNFLANLNLSKIFIGIELFVLTDIDIVPHTQDFPKLMVEDLLLKVHSSTSICPALLDGIIWKLRPKFITQYFFPISDKSCWKASNEFFYLLYKKLTGTDQASRNCCNSTDKMIGWHELKEANVEVYEDTLMEWWPLPCRNVLNVVDALRSPEKELRIRLRLRWGTT